jgi:CheY-like chemotaxis protein
MVVDNDADVKAFLAHAQRSHDAVWLPGGGIAALRRLNEVDYDIDAVVTDLTLDDVDGITLTEHIRRNESIRSKDRGCLVFWFTSYPINETIENLKAKHRVTEIFVKPMTPTDIISRVKSYLGLAHRPAIAA